MFIFKNERVYKNFFVLVKILYNYEEFSFKKEN